MSQKTNCGHKVSDYYYVETNEYGMDIYKCKICGTEEIPESM